MSEASQKDTPTIGSIGQAMSATDRQDFETLMRLNPLAQTQAFQFARSLQEIAIILGSYASVSLEVFSRHTFGERYMTPLRVMIGAGLMFLFTVFGSTISALGGGQRGLLLTNSGLQFVVMGLFGFAFVVVSLWHLFNNFYRVHYTGEQWYSRSFGISLLEPLLGRRFMALPPISDWYLFLYVEPFLWYVIGSVLTILGHFLPTGLLGLWILFCTTFLLLKNQMFYYAQREQDLDLNDARLGSMNHSRSAQGLSKRDTAGYSAVPLPLAADRNRDGRLDAPAITPGMFAAPAALSSGEAEVKP